jgi:hypothetical protein
MMEAITLTGQAGTKNRSKRHLSQSRKGRKGNLSILFFKLKTEPFFASLASSREKILLF